MLADEVVGINPRLVSVVDLRACVLSDLGRKLLRVECPAGLHLVRAGEEDLLGDELIVNHARHEATFDNRKATGTREHERHDRLKRDDPPPNCRVHSSSS